MLQKSLGKKRPALNAPNVVGRTLMFRRLDYLYLPTCRAWKTSTQCQWWVTKSLSKPTCPDSMAIKQKEAAISGNTRILVPSPPKKILFSKSWLAGGVPVMRVAGRSPFAWKFVPCLYINNYFNKLALVVMIDDWESEPEYSDNRFNSAHQDFHFI